jgi:DNA-binding transcriptional MerR regulator
VRCIGIKEFARRSGVSVRTLEREKAAGKLPPHRVIRGRHVWTEEDVETYLRALPRFDEGEAA